MDPELFQLALKVGKTLESKNLVMSTAESCTGGWIAKVVTDVAGSSGWFDRGFVCYSNLAKSQQLGVPDVLLEAEGAVSEAVARAMVEGALNASAAQIAIAVTGIAGPDGGTKDKPIGTVWFAWASSSGVDTAVHQFTGDREAVRRQTLVTALEGIVERVGSKDE
jgi:nicotinamide-nucleotide amidase